MKKISNYIVFVFIIASSFIAGYYYGINRVSCKTVTTVETISDTIKSVSPVELSEIVLGTERYTLPRYYFKGSAGGVSRQKRVLDDDDTVLLVEPNVLSDTIGVSSCCFAVEADSAVVELPIIQRHYSEKGYDAWVSGALNPSLDSIKIYSTTSVITKRENSHLGRYQIGVSVGCGYTPRGIEPYIGVGITYSIFSF